MAQASWAQPSPRRGFTLIREADTLESGPVVVCCDGSPESLRAVEAAAREALLRSANLVVLDQGEHDLRQLIAHPANGSTAVLISAVARALQSPRVEVLRVEGLGPDLGVRIQRWGPHCSFSPASKPSVSPPRRLATS